jgi:hypothetical protein
LVPHEEVSYFSSCYTRAAKPKLTENHRTTRLEFVRNKISSDIPGYFDPQYQTIHIDEKWFLKRETQMRAYVADDEEAIYETAQLKAHIDKVMFLAAVAHPR